MEHISINGEKYIKASSIARELGYTADYVGQLCRGGKVDAQLVGRSWFVGETSIRAHKRDRYRSTAAKSKEAIQKVMEQPEEGVRAASVRPDPFFHVKPPLQTVRYETDHDDLIPSILEKRVNEAPLSEEKPTVENVEAQQKPVTARQPLIEDAVHIVPVRKVAPQRQPKKTAARLRAEQELLHTETPREPIEHTRVQVAAPVKSSMFPAVLIALLIAIIGSLAFIGVEDRIIAESGTIEVTYQFSPATAFDAVKERLK